VSIIYDLIFLVISIFYLPVYILRGKFQRGFMARLGVLPKGLALDQPIWIHAVSVGEAQAVRILVEGLRKAYPAQKFVISTVTATGNKIAKTFAKDGDLVTYLPLDFSFIVRKTINKIKPKIFILAETEIWPNLISYLYKKNIPTAVVNGRISGRSFKGYRLIKFLAQPILAKIRLFCVQTERDAERLRSLGVAADKIKVTGNMKFDISIDTQKDYSAYRLKLGLLPDEKLLVAGSTHPQEEEIILGVYQELCVTYPGLKLLIAPRHPERAAEVAALTKRSGFFPLRISLLNSRTREPENPRTVFILDSIGELLNYYAIAEIIFVGGSLVKKGGHNILEPAALGKPVLFGPQMFNFRDIAELFLSAQAALAVSGPEELKTRISDLLSDPSLIAQLGERAREVVFRNQGASPRNLEFLSFFFAAD